MAIDHDGLFKELLITFFQEFVELFAPDVLKYGDPASITLASTETFQDSHEVGQRRSDLVVQVDFTNESTAFFLIHIEIQSQTETDFAKRMFHYFARLHQLHDTPIYPIALFAYDTSNRDEPDTFSISFPDRKVLEFKFLKIHLRKLNWRDYLNHHNPIAAALMAKMGYGKHERARVKVECLRLLAKLDPNPTKARLIGRFIDTYLELDEEEREEYNEIMEAMPMADKQAVTEVLTSWEQMGIEKGLERGLEKGLQEGLQQGRQQGLQQGLEEGLKRMRKLVLSWIEARFGPMPTEDQSAFEQLSFEALEKLGLAVANATSYAELRELFHQSTI